ncbi:CDP-alcohol phosphatidyltransferase family protein, partial [Streptomyces sp. SID11233]|nr:CDP-alcohol phosphatidyltransferase family protein [Streptomyces sp. SID11233]
DLVGVARHQAGLPVVKDAAAEPRSSGMALARRAAAALQFHRLILGIEASLLIIVLAVIDQIRGDLFFTRLGIAVLAAIALVQTLLHLVSILASSRLK